MNKTMEDFIKELSSDAPIPGGGGASALIGAIGLALCAMVANITTRRQKGFQEELDMSSLLERTTNCTKRLLELIQKDGEAFEPLSRAYRLPVEAPDRELIMEKALIEAATVPLELLEEVGQSIDILEELFEKGAKLVISDVAVAASSCKSAMEGAIMNVYCNTRSMKNREYALLLNDRAEQLFNEGVGRCNIIYQKVKEELIRL